MNLSLEDYFKTSFEEKLLIKMPERENDHLTVATRLLDKRREMNEVDQALNAQKEEFQMKMESLAQRKEELTKKEYQLPEALLKFDKFLKENDAKKIRALNKVLEEKSIKRQKMDEIKKLKEEIGKNEKIKERVKQKLNRYEIFQKYLEQVTEVSEDISEIREIIDRYDTLTSNLDELKERNRENYASIDERKGDLGQKRKDKDRTVINCNIKLAEYQQHLDKLKSKVIKLDDEYTETRQSLAEEDLLAGKIIISTYNIYRTIVKEDNKFIQPIPVDKTAEQLTEISNFTCSLADIKAIAENITMKN